MKDIFSFNGSYKSLNLENQQELIVKKRNLWYAGRIAYCLPNEQWKSLDDAPKPKVKAKRKKKAA